MSKLLKHTVITPVYRNDTVEGYQATVELQDGERATSIVFDDSTEASAWGIKYAEQAQAAQNAPKSEEIASTTESVTQAPANDGSQA